MDKEDIIHKGKLLEGNDLITEYRLRGVEYFTQSIPNEAAVPEGWEVTREFKTRKRIVKKKGIAITLEDEIWRLLFDIGAQKLSSRDFTLILKHREELNKTKQIDVLAIDHEIVFVIECKSQESLGKKSLKKDIAEFASIQNDIRSAVRKLLDNRELEFIFIFVTENIEWNDNDKLDAKEANILIWDEYDIMALEDLAKLAGQGAKYQIYNRVFMGKRIKGFEIKVPAIEAKMGCYLYYTFVLSPEELLKISYVHHRSGRSGFLELADSYQRMIKASRIRRIEQFIEDGGFFPGSIIINLHRPLLRREILGDIKHREQLSANSCPVVITLPPYYGCAWLIDGQHRLYAYADLDKKYKETVPVIAFVEKSGNIEAKLFVDINKNQKAIESNLLWDLYEDLYVNSNDEQEKQLYTISKIAKKLNSDKISPFYNHISIPKEQNSGNLTLTTICTAIKQQKLISPQENLLFRNSYDETIDFATERIECFFRLIKESMTTEWEKGDQHYVRTNSGFVVLLGILHDIVECNLSKDEHENIQKFNRVATRLIEPLLIHLLGADQETIRNYRGAGGAGQKSRQVRVELTKIIRNTPQIGFRSIWLEKYENALQEDKKFPETRRRAQYYLDSDENEILEFKGSILLDLNRYLKGDGKLEEEAKLVDECILKTVVAFLNSKGGEILIGVLEQSKFIQEYEEKLSDLPIYKDKIIYGIEIEYKKDKWDGYLQRLQHFIESRIGPEVLDMDIVKISKLTYESKDICLVSIKPADSRQYLYNSNFFIRRGNTTVQLKGQEIDKYWSSRPKN